MVISLGLYKKSLAFWSAVFLIGLSITGALQGQPPTADVVTGQPTIGQTLTVNVAISENGQTLVNGERIRQTIFPARTVDRFRLKILDELPQQFDQVAVTVTLPKPVAIRSLNARGLLIHSFGNEVTTSAVDNRTIRFVTTTVAPNAILTITFDLPKGYLNLPVSLWIKGQLTTLPATLWLAAGLLFPVVTAAFFAIQLYRRLIFLLHLKRAPMLSQPPSKLPAAAVGVLYHTVISPRELAATLVDLAVSRILTIYVKPGGDFTFSRNPVEPNRLFEKTLLSKLFYSQQIFSRRADVLYRVGHRVFSHKIARVYWEIYRLLESQGYFLEAPTAVMYRSRAIGVLLFFAGVTGFFTGVIFFPEPKFPLLLWVGVIVGSLLNYTFAPLAVHLSPWGMTELKGWAGFKKYLALKTPVPYQEAIDGRLERYLPYAMVLNVEQPWLQRFADHPFVPPRWFDSSETVRSLEQFSQRILPITGFVGHLLVESREPVL